jgi:hypothetical protein
VRAQLSLGFDLIIDQSAPLFAAVAAVPAAAAEIAPSDPIALYRDMIDRHHEAMVSGDEERVFQIREEAHKFAREMNGGNPGILGGSDSSGNVLMRETRAPSGTVPKWGQMGEFIVTVGSMSVRIEQSGMLGIGGSSMIWMGFYAHAVDFEKPFLSDTGFRSFLGLQASLVPGMTPDTVATEVIRGYVEKERKGKLTMIEAGYAERALARLKAKS